MQLSLNERSQAEMCGIFLGQATLGGARADVGAAFGSRFTNSAFAFTVSGLAAGLYDLAVYARSTVSGSFNQSKGARINVQ